MDRKEELRKVIDDARNELSKIEDKEWMENNQKYVGRYYKYRNSYSDGKKWWFYFTVTKIEGHELIGWTFERTADEEININLKYYADSLIRYSTEIIPLEFHKAWDKLLTELKAI